MSDLGVVGIENIDEVESAHSQAGILKYRELEPPIAGFYFLTVCWKCRALLTQVAVGSLYGYWTSAELFRARDEPVFVSIPSIAMLVRQWPRGMTEFLRGMYQEQVAPQFPQAQRPLLGRRYPKAAGYEYLANICPQCQQVQGDAHTHATADPTLRIGTHEPTPLSIVVSGSTDRLAVFCGTRPLLPSARSLAGAPFDYQSGWLGCAACHRGGQVADGTPDFRCQPCQLNPMRATAAEPLHSYIVDLMDRAQRAFRGQAVAGDAPSAPSTLN